MPKYKKRGMMLPESESFRGVDSFVRNLQRGRFGIHKRQCARPARAAVENSASQFNT